MIYVNGTKKIQSRKNSVRKLGIHMQNNELQAILHTFLKN